MLPKQLESTLYQPTPGIYLHTGKEAISAFSSCTRCAKTDENMQAFIPQQVNYSKQLEP